MRTLFINAGITPKMMTEIPKEFGNSSVVTIFCDSKTRREFLSTQRLLELRYRPWKGAPFSPSPGKL